MKLVSIFTAHWERFVEGSQAMLTAAHYRAARAVQWCRTAALGGQLYECPDCDKQKFAWHSCNHRSCLQCGAQDQQEWAAAQEAKLLRAPYFMITVTLPEELRRFVYKEQEWFYGLFFAAVSGALKDLGQDPKHLGGSIGMTAVLHTWTREMHYHPHLHVIMPGVAIDQDGHRIQRAKGRRYLFPKAVLNVVFRNRIKKLLTEKDAKDKTRHMDEIDPDIWKKPWVINAKAVGKGRSALRYLAKYVFKSALSESRLLGYDAGGRIRLNCQDSGTGAWHERHLAPTEFLRRWSLHVLPKGLMRVRHYGFLSAAGKKRRERVATIIGVQPSELPPVTTDPDKAGSAAQEGNVAVPPATAATADAGEKASRSVPPCPCCGKTMEFVRRIKPLDLWIRTPLTPPPAATGWTSGQARPPNPGSPPDAPCS